MLRPCLACFDNIYLEIGTIFSLNSLFLLKLFISVALACYLGMVDSHKRSPVWLLLLPRPPSEISLNTLKVAYGPGLSQVLQMASNASTESSSVILDIAIAYQDELLFRYSKIQKLLGLMYKLICIIFTEKYIDLQYGNDVDARLVVFHRDVFDQPGPAQRTASQRQNSFGDLQILARNDRAWQRLFSLDGEPAENLLRDFLRIRGETSDEVTRNRHIEIERLPGGLTILQSSPENATQESPCHHHHSVAVGGTFDHLHAGHKLLLTMTALVLDPKPDLGGSLTIGITGDELLKKKEFKEELEDFPARQLAVQNFLLGILGLISLSHTLINTKQVGSTLSRGREIHNTLKSGLTIRYVEIFDPCGPTITDETITALVLSAETRGGGQVVNGKRGGKGWPALEIFEVDVLDTGGDSKDQEESNFRGKISSTDIRRRIREKAALMSGGLKPGTASKSD